MLRVKLSDKDVKVGALEFFGTPVAKADGSSWIEFEANDQPCAGQVKIIPAGIATGPEIRVIANSLCRNETKGKAGRYHWELTSAPSEPNSTDIARTPAK
jgi:predicted ATP-dependent Lon-type protease